MTTVRRLKASQFAEQFAKDVATIRSRLVEATHETASTGAKLVAQAAPRAFGELADGVVPIELRSGAKIRSSAPHSAAVEVGARPHMPPVVPLVRWARLRGMQDPEQAGWAIAMAIKKRGTRPTWFVRRSLPLIRAVLGANVRARLSRPL